MFVNGTFQGNEDWVRKHASPDVWGHMDMTGQRLVDKRIVQPKRGLTLQKHAQQVSSRGQSSDEPEFLTTNSVVQTIVQVLWISGALLDKTAAVQSRSTTAHTSQMLDLCNSTNSTISTAAMHLTGTGVMAQGSPSFHFQRKDGQYGS